MISGYKAAIFDMDGTLLDSMRQWRFAALEYLMAQHMPISEEVLSGVFRRGGVATVKMCYQQAGIDPDSLGVNFGRAILEYVAPHYEKDVTVKNNARELLEKLRAEGIVCCVATATPKQYAEAALKAHGLDRYLEFVFDETDGGCTKANCQYFQRLVDRLGFAPSECVMFEDAMYSIRTAKKSGLTVIGVYDECALDPPEAISAATDYYIKDFSEML